MKRYAQLLVFALCVAFSVGALINTLGDNADVQRLASGVACGGDGRTCGTTLVRMERTPLSQTFDLATKEGTVTVRCVRSFYLFGAYACAAP